MAIQKEQRSILVVDGQGLMREGLVRIIEREKDLTCCAAVGSAVAAHEAVALYKPDLVLADLLLPDAGGLEMIKRLVSEYPSLLVLVISQCDETVYAERALKAGARGYVMKNIAVPEIPKAIRAILAGEFFVSPRVAALALDRMAGAKPRNRSESVGNLTDRELQVFQLLGAGTDSRGVADKLHLSVKTIETHRENIKQKLKLYSASELIHCATNWVESQGSNHQLLPGKHDANFGRSRGQRPESCAGR